MEKITKVEDGKDKADEEDEKFNEEENDEEH